MIHLFLTPSGDLMAFEKMPKEPLSFCRCDGNHCDEFGDDSPYSSRCKFGYEQALQSAKASAVKVKNHDQVHRWINEQKEGHRSVFESLDSYPRVYTLENYKMVIEPEYCELLIIGKLAIISPIEEQKEPLVDTGSKETQAQIFDDMFCLYFDLRHELMLSGYEACNKIQELFTITRK